MLLKKKSFSSFYHWICFSQKDDYNLSSPLRHYTDNVMQNILSSVR